MEKHLQISKFLSFLEKDGLMVIFHRLHPIPIYLKTNEWKRFKRNLKKKENKKLIEELKKQRLIIYSKKEDEKELNIIKREFEEKIRQTSALFLILTHNCNLKCKYCFIPHSFKVSKNRMMRPEMARKGIDLWLRHVKDNFREEKNYSIIFYGGEPLLNIRTLKESVEYIQKKWGENGFPQNNLQILVDTNGILINKKIIQLFKKYNIKVNISLDGPKKFHDYYRVDSKGRGTFKKVIKVIQQLRQKRINTCISVTITPYNITEIINFPKFFSQNKIKEFGFIPLTSSSLFLLNPQINLKEYHEKVAEEIINSYRAIKKKEIYEYRILEKVKSFIEGDFFPMDCSAYGGQIVIQPDGMVSNCPASSKYNIKHIDKCGENFRIWNISSIRKWHERLPLYNSKCLNCKAISICGGGCPWDVEEVKGNIFQRDESTCIFSRKFFKFLIWNL